MAARRHSLSTYIALAAAGMVVALGIAQAVVTSDPGPDSIGSGQATTALYAVGPNR